MYKVILIYSGHMIDYLQGIVSGLSNEKFLVDIIDAKRKDGSIRIPNKCENITLYKYLDKTKPTTLFWLSLTWSVYYFRLIKHIILSDAKIVHIEWINHRNRIFEEYILTTIYKLLRKKIVFKVHDLNTKALLAKKKNFQNEVPKSKSYFLNRVDIFFVHNNYVKNILINSGINENKIKITPQGVYNYVVPKGINSIVSKSKFNIPSNAKTILFFGNISPYKGFDNLLAIFSRLSEKIKDVYLLVGGNFRKEHNEYREQIVKKISKMDKARLRINFKFIPEDEVEYYFAAADVLCLPHLFINQSGVPFLSYAFGLPIFARNVGGLSEDIIVNKTGMIFNDDEELYKLLCDFYEGKLELLSKDELIKYTKEKFSWDKITSKYIDYYKEVLN